MKSLREWRTEKLLTIRDLAAKANVANQTIVQIEHGRISPRTRTIRRLCEALGVGPEDVLEFGEALRRAVDEAEPEEASDEPSPAGTAVPPHRFQPLLDAMPETTLGGISTSGTVGFILGPDGTVRFASPSLNRVIGIAPDDQPGSDIFDAMIQFVHPDDQYETMRLIHYLLVTPGAVDEISHRVRLVDGAWREMRLHGTNLIDHPAIEGVILVASPLTGG